VAAQCRKGARIKVSRSNLLHVLEHDEQGETLKGYGNSRNFFGTKIYLRVGSKATIFNSTTYLLAFKMSSSNAGSTTKVLQQVDGAEIQEGGWVGGDAWFGSMMSVIETYKRKKVHSTFIIKNNQTFFPMQPLHAVLKARYYGNHPAGHWVVFQATISDVKVFALAYAWSRRGVSYFLSTCGKTSPHEVMYMSHFKDDFGNVVHKEIDRPEVCHFLCEYLPLIDEHNKQRQNLLNLERCWCTKDPWMRLLSTTLGMCVVDMHRWYRNKKYEEQL
jgi:hypothetical protein